MGPSEFRALLEKAKRHEDDDGLDYDHRDVIKAECATMNRAELFAELWQRALEVRDFYIQIGLEEHGVPSVPASIHEMVLTLAKLDACP